MSHIDYADIAHTLIKYLHYCFNYMYNFQGVLHFS